MSPELQQFLDSLHAPPDPRTLAWDVQGLDALSSAERLTAEDALLDRAARLGDTRAIKSLALLGTTRAVPALEALRKSGSGFVRHAAARALGIITGDQATIGALVDAFGAGGNVDAFTAWDLKSMPGDEAYRGLVLALRSTDLPARMHALDGLAARTSVEALRQPDQSPLGRYELLLGSGLRALYLPAAFALADLFTQLAAGADAAALGLVYVPSDDRTLASTFWESCGATGAPYAEELLTAMGEHDRAWAHALIVARAEDRDPRSLNAIVRQRLLWAMRVLEEIATRDATTEPAFANQVNLALAALKS